MNNKELVAAGHEFARHMSSDTPIIDIAKMVTRLASQLDVTTAALRHAYAQFDSQSLELKAAVAAEIDWEKSMMQAVGADGIADVVSAIENMKTDGAALSAENAALKQSKPSLKAMMSALDAFYADEEVPESAMLIAYNILRGDVETSATDRFIADQQAIGVEKVGEYLRGYAQGLHEEARLVLQDAKELCLGYAVRLRDEVRP
ncbi:hypothetical protein ACMGGS_12080 [Superficieibacter sp. BNK-5]|uniref:hypothetical protein n=1 Tax=Superficieibacter sp. BNK-5 TaxID=3376142 RepID=UPI0039BF3949